MRYVRSLEDGFLGPDEKQVWTSADSQISIHMTCHLKTFPFKIHGEKLGSQIPSSKLPMERWHMLVPSGRSLIIIESRQTYRVTKTTRSTRNDLRVWKKIIGPKPQGLAPVCFTLFVRLILYWACWTERSWRGNTGGFSQVTSSFEQTMTIVYQ